MTRRLKKKTRLIVFTFLPQPRTVTTRLIIGIKEEKGQDAAWVRRKQQHTSTPVSPMRPGARGLIRRQQLHEQPSVCRRLEESVKAYAACGLMRLPTHTHSTIPAFNEDAHGAAQCQLCETGRQRARAQSWDQTLDRLLVSGRVWGFERFTSESLSDWRVYTAGWRLYSLNISSLLPLLCTLSSALFRKHHQVGRDALWTNGCFVFSFKKSQD